MANTIRVKRRAAGGAVGAPVSLENAELAYNEQDDTLYYGKGTGGAGGTATVVIPIGGPGAFTQVSHVGSGGTSHADAVANGADGFMTGADKAKLDGVAVSATANTGTVTTVSFTTGNGITGAVTNASTTPAIALTLGAVTGTSFNAVTGLSDANGAALGTAAVGTGTTAARADHVHQLPLLNALGLPTAAVALNSQKITGLAEPTLAQDAATKNYVDSVAQGLDAKASAVVATTANITLSGVQTIDGIAVVAGNLVLVKNQTTASQNGIYTVNTGAWIRGAGCNTWDELVSAFVFVENGTTNANNGYLCTVLAGGTLGTTAVSFVQFSGAGQIDAGTGLTKSGNTLNVATASTARIVVNADSIDLATTAVTAGTYRSVTTDVYGRITAGTNPTTLATYGITDALPTSANIDGGTY